MDASANRLARRLKMRDLEIVATIGQTRSLSRTASTMAMTQPALSKWLKELEALLGMPLFDRTTRRLVPTEAGFVVMDHASRILGDLARVSGELDALRAGHGSVVRVGAPSAVAAVVIPRAASYLLDQGFRHPIQLQEDTLDHLMPRLFNRELDIVLGRLDASLLNAGCHHERLFDGPVCVAAARKHPLFARRKVTWRDTLAYPWILPPAQSPMRQSLEDAFAQAGLATPAAFMSSSSVLVNQAVALDSECLFIASLQSVREMEKGGAVGPLPLLLPGLPLGIGMLWADNVTPPVAAFMEALRISASRLA
ncbi:LysR substrate-binding domain-containing protein [Paraburkholderia silviterrae]|uniref:LysR family transcriptional regulator n=1 Tax=Paraburkholderia silviterrae TaxID=2528715 RepID=A0A4R5M5S1_9BURK|nr:LysR substrate-binding domain-containing protein [Paraburkholderia silviterrae]TDG21305.1 LysR family transcriptional regulator [Paraburkholderia silviterrae]